MDVKRLSDDLAAAPQIGVADMRDIAAAGYRALICDRPDGEGSGQPSFATIEAEAKKRGLAARYLPVVPGKMTEADVAAFKQAVAELPKPILGYCASGKRVEALAKAAGLVTDRA